ncbi:uncharacterized protein LOC141538072 isoform X1 [Cotesia typhae]|uniref:uncharacterized protein LOC141538072 isoform X1 n=1 Tax=Cotesia typhae TaxID=2053667 RepID=UPI003D69D425
MKIGFIDEEKGQVYMGYDKWITTNFYHKLMALPKIQLFVENVARFVFGDEVLLKSTVSGKTSNRSKNKSTEIYQLDPTSLSQTRGFFEHYLRNSVFTHGMHENIIFKHLGSLERYISKFIAKFKGNTIKTKTEKAVKEPTPPLRSNHDSEDEGEIQINNGVDGEMDDLNEEPDSEDSTAFIIDES